MQSNGAKLMIPPLVRALSTSTAAAGSAVAVSKPSSGGSLINLLGFGSSRVTTPLSEALPGAPIPARSSAPSVPAKLETSALAEGVKVAALKTTGPSATVALLVGGGSSAETDATAGASKALAAMAFKATNERSTFRVTRELEKIGTASATATREGIFYAIQTNPMHIPEATELLLDTVLNAKLQYFEVRDNAEIAKAVGAASPSAVLEDILHRVAYDGPLGQPSVVDPSVLEGMTNETLREYHASLLHPGNLLLASYGTDVNHLKVLSQPVVAAAHLGQGSAVPASKYVGGASSVVAHSPLTYAALAFEAKGGLSDTKASAVAAVAKALLDESRAALPHADNSGDVSAVSAFTHLYKGTGLVGVSASAAPSKSSQLVDSLFKKVEAVASGVSEQQLKVAKAVAMASYKGALATGATGLPVIAAELMARGSSDAAQFAAAVEAVTPTQVASFIKDSAKSSPTLVSYGGLARLPRLDSVLKRLA